MAKESKHVNLNDSSYNHSQHKKTPFSDTHLSNLNVYVYCVYLQWLHKIMYYIASIRPIPSRYVSLGAIHTYYFPLHGHILNTLPQLLDFLRDTTILVNPV